MTQRRGKRMRRSRRSVSGSCSFACVWVCLDQLLFHCFSNFIEGRFYAWLCFFQKLTQIGYEMIGVAVLQFFFIHSMENLLTVTYNFPGQSSRCA